MARSLLGADLPNLLIVGAPRAGTTFLSAAMSSVPGIFVPRVKEPHYHLADRWPLGGPEAETFTRPIAEYLAGRRRKVWGGLITSEAAYRSLYADAGQATWRIEATPNYFAEGGFMARRLADRLGPNLRVIVALRDPVARAVSHYRLFRQLGWEDRLFAEAIALGPERVRNGWAPTWDYLRYSAIVDPLAEWRAVFGSRLHTVTAEAIRYTPHETFAAMGDWLGLPMAGVDLAAERNASDGGEDTDLAVAERAVAAEGRLNLSAERAALAEVRATEVPLPLVSVGMPVRNGETTIGTALDSLSQQTYPALEVVVCNNASTDGTAEVVRQRAAADPRIQLVQFDAPADIQTSYRRALDSRRGTYFLFAPADDSWAPDFLARAVARMQADHALAVCCGEILQIDEKGRERPSRGVRPINGTPQQRWRRALTLSYDASRLYGLLRSTALEDIIPTTAPEGWDHYTAAKLALRGPVAVIDALAMRRHRTPFTVYRARIVVQEPTPTARLLAMRRVADLFRADPEIRSDDFPGRIALAAFVLLHLQAGLTAPGLSPLRWIVRRVARLLGGLARTMP